ncbi:MAG: PAS domain S-box protein, partial [Polyangiaceae bacterium]|nr:PAS domain S-box protein [Polyangiaceae bacterium]
HRRAQQALRQSEEAFRSLIEASPDSVLVLRRSRIAYANPRAVRYLGFAYAAEIIGREFADFLCEEDRPLVERWDDAAEPRQGTPTELRLMRFDGSFVTGEVTDMPVVYAGHRSVLALIRDLTDRKEMQSRLVLADRLASVGTLAAGVAHELNNPLSYVLSNIALTRETLDAPFDSDTLEAMRQQLDEAIHGAGRMRDIVLDLKTFSQVETEQHELVETKSVLESSINMCRNELRHRAKLVLELGPTPPLAMNASRLGQIFLNLLINAAQAMSEERVETNVLRVRSYTDEHGWGVVEFHDTGEGIAEPNLSRVFDPFFTTKSGAGGTGLGLSICQNIVSAAGGKISVNSVL